MSKYQCIVCDYFTDIKCNYERHLKSEKHLKSQTYSKIYKCEYCNKTYKYSQGLSKHLKYSCKKSNDEDLKEFVRLLNEKNKMLEKSMNYNSSDIMKNKLLKTDKCIELLTKKLDIVKLGNSNNLNIQNNTTNNNYYCPTNNYNTINSNNVVQITNNNTFVLNYKDTDMSHLTPQDFKQIISRKLNCIPEFVRRVHCNKQLPQNMNIYIPNIKNKFIMLYKDGEWLLHDRDSILEELIEDRACRLEEWLDDNPEESHRLKDTFNEFLDYRNNNFDECNKKLKSEIQKDLYNIRHTVGKNKLKSIK